MTFSNQNRRPTKRCRRGKNNNGGCSINFNNQANRLNSFSFCTNKKDHQFPSLILLLTLTLLGLAILILILSILFNKEVYLSIIKLIEYMDVNNFSPMAACTVKSRLTKSALVEVEEIYNVKFSNRQSKKIRRRDIRRAHAKSERNLLLLKEIRKEVKYLKDSVRGPKKEARYEKKANKTTNCECSKEVFCSSEEVNHLSLVTEKNINSAELVAQFTNTKDNINEAGRLIKVFLESTCSFRSFSNIIKNLSKHKLYAGKFNPSYGTYINWMMRAGIAKLTTVKKIEGECVDIIDHWIGKGNIKLFAVLRITKAKYQTAIDCQKAPSLKDYELISIEVVNKSNGVLVSQSLKKLYAKVGAPVAIISDCGGDLVKGIRLLHPENDISKTKMIFHIQDISHKMACILKKRYQNEDWFNSFYSLLGKLSKRLHSSQYSHLAPPAQNIKARFMNINKQIIWYINNFSKLEEVAAQNESIMEICTNLKKIKKEVENIYNIIARINDIMKMVKNQGLDERTFKLSKIIILKINDKQIRESIKEWLSLQNKTRTHLSELKWNIPMPISSDVVESFFSKYKILQNRTPEGDPTRLVAMLPLLVGDNSSSQINDQLRSISHKKALEWIKENIPETIHSKKRKLLGKSGSKRLPKACCLIDQAERPYEKCLAA